MVAGTGGDGHHGKSLVLAATAHKAGAIHDKEILDVVSLIVGGEDGCFRVVSHPRRANLVNSHAWNGQLGIGHDVPSTGRLQHLGGRHGTILQQGFFVWTVSHVNA